MENEDIRYDIEQDRLADQRRREQEGETIEEMNQGLPGSNGLC